MIKIELDPAQLEAAIAKVAMNGIESGMGSYNMADLISKSVQVAAQEANFPALVSKAVRAVFEEDAARIAQKVAASARKAFEAEFNDSKVTEKIEPEKFGNWVKRDIELIGAYAMMDDWLEAPPFSDAEKAKIRAAVAKGDEDALNPYVSDIMNKTLARLPKEGITRNPSWDDTVQLRKLARELVGNVELRGNATQAEVIAMRAALKKVEAERDEIRNRNYKIDNELSELREKLEKSAAPV